MLIILLALKLNSDPATVELASLPNSGLSALKVSKIDISIFDTVALLSMICIWPL